MKIVKKGINKKVIGICSICRTEIETNLFSIEYQYSNKRLYCWCPYCRNSSVNCELVEGDIVTQVDADRAGRPGSYLITKKSDVKHLLGTCNVCTSVVEYELGEEEVEYDWGEKTWEAQCPFCKIRIDNLKEVVIGGQ